MKLTILAVLAAFAMNPQTASAQGVNDPTGPLVRQPSSSPLPSNTTPPTANRPSSVFSPGAPTPRAQRAYRPGRRFR